MLLKDYNIKNDLVVDYQMNDSVKRLLYDFFVIFDEEFQAEANINDRNELDK